MKSHLTPFAALVGLVLSAASPGLADPPARVSVDAQATDTARVVKGSVVLVPQAVASNSVSASIGLAAGAGAPAPVLGKDPPRDQAAWRDLSLSANASWKRPGAQLQLEATDAIWLGGNGGLREDRSATLAADLAPSAPISLNLKGGVVNALSQSPAPAGAVHETVSLVRDGASASAGLRWKLTPNIVLSGQQHIETANLAWRGDGAYQGRGIVTRPAVEGALTLAPGSEVTLKAEHFAAPFDGDKFSALARAMFTQARAGETHALQPDQEWRLAATASQVIGPARLTITAVDARLDSSTELALGPLGAAVPAAVAGGWRTDVRVGLEAPLDLAGLTGVRITSQWMQRSSGLRDPVTGETRSVSGEAPWEGRLGLGYAPPGATFSVGVESQMIGPRTFYEPARLREIDAVAHAAAYLELRSMSSALRLQIDNLIDSGGRITDTQFQRDRSSGNILQIDRHYDANTAITLTLKRKV